MLRPAFDFGKQALTLMKDVQQNKNDIKELRQEMKEVRQELKDLTAVVHQFAFQMQRGENPGDWLEMCGYDRNWRDPIADLDPKMQKIVTQIQALTPDKRDMVESYVDYLSKK